MPFDSLVAHGLNCALSGYYRVSKALFDECLNGMPAYTNCLIIGIDPDTNQREVGFFIPQGEIFDKKTLIDLFYKPYVFELVFFQVSLEDVPIFSTPGSKCCRLSNASRIGEFCNTIAYESRHKYLFRENILSATLEKISLYLLRDIGESSPQDFEKINQHFENRRLLRVLSYIHQRLNEEITLESLGALVYLSPDYVSQFFKRCVGMPIQSYLIDQRVKLGMYLLITSTEAIANIAENTGFVDQAYFNRRFKMFIKMNPLKVRKKYQLLNVSQAGAMMAWPSE